MPQVAEDKETGFEIFDDGHKEIRLVKNGEVFFVLNINAADNRPVAIRDRLAELKGEEQQKAAKFLFDYLQQKVVDKELFGAKQYIICLREHQSIFASYGFSADYQSDKNTARVRITSSEKITTGTKNIREALKKDPRFAKLTLERMSNPNGYFEAILNLMADSGFTPEKIQDYIRKGPSGIRLMCENAVFLLNEKRELFGLCVIADYGKDPLGNRWGYLGDTLIRPEFFMIDEVRVESKEQKSDPGKNNASKSRWYRIFIW